jgi:competence protein ComEC
MLRPRRPGLVHAALACVLLGLGLLGCGESTTGSTTLLTQSPQPASPSSQGAKTQPTKKPNTQTSSKPKATPTAKATTKPSASTASAGVEIVFVNVGQGDAILLKSGSTEVLVDGGPSGESGVVENAMQHAGIKDLDWVVVSHMHEDHIGDTPELVYDWAPERAAIAGSCDSSLASAFRAEHTKVTQVRRRDTLTLGSLKAQVLSPGSISGDKNADSVVLLLEVAGKRILLTGDCTGPNEAVVGSIVARGPPLYVLKVAHHGSSYSTGSTFLSETDPKFAIIEVGPNSYGHPTPETVSRLRSFGATVYTTQRNGTVTLVISPSGSAKWSFAKTSKPLLKVASSSGESNSGGSSTGGSNASSGSGDGTIVYATETGECYHRKGCQYLSHSCIPISLADAKARGYRPCSICRPPQ